MIGQSQQLKQNQKLSPQQIQMIKLLEVPIQELQQRIREEIESNPVLDESSAELQSKDISIDELKEGDDIPGYRLKVNNWGRDPRPEHNTFSVRESFTQSLETQLGFKNLSDKENRIALFIIGSLDNDGYLRRELESLVDDMAFRAGIETDAQEVERMLKVIQEFEPAGVGARNLRECLMLQLRACKQDEDVELAYRIIEDCFQEFSNRNFGRIMERLDISEEKMKEAIVRITKLNPAPGGQIDDNYTEQAQQVMPDFLLEEDSDGNLSFSMPRFNIPEVRLSRKYSDMLNDGRDSGDREKKEAVVFIRQKMESAKWFVEALKQRQNTLQKTMQAILDYQHDFFASGDESRLRPMVLKNIAEKTGFDISTISRVVNSKYIDTPYGIYQLKYFFSEGLENSEGEEVSTRGVKKALQQCIDGEDKKNPLTDEQIVAELAGLGYKVARRTVAKYRDQLGIPLARWRREL